MRLRTSTRWGVGTLAVLWTVMLLFVSIQLFLHASSVLTLVENSDKQFESLTTILRDSARYDGRNQPEFRDHVEQAVQQLTADTQHQPRTDAQQTVLNEGQRWVDGEVADTVALRAASQQLALESAEQVSAIRTGHRLEAHIAILISSVALLLALLFIRYLLVRLVNPLEEVFHYVESRPPSSVLPRFVPLPAVYELGVIEASLKALGDSRRAYLDARNAYVPFGDQQAVEALLERVEEPVWVLAPTGTILGANNSAMDVLAGTRGRETREELYGLVPFFAADFDNADTEAMQVPPWWDLKIAPNGEAMVCVLRLNIERGQ